MFDIINVDQNETSTRTYFILSPNIKNYVLRILYDKFSARYESVNVIII